MRCGPVYLLTLYLMVCGLCGCAVLPQTQGGEAQPHPAAAATGQVQSAPEQLTAKQQAALENVARLTAAIGDGAAPAAATGPNVKWLDIRHPSARAKRPTASTPPPAPASLPGAALTAATIHEPPAAALQQASFRIPEPTAARGSRQASERTTLADALLRQIRDSDDPYVAKALNAATLSLFAADRQLPADLLGGLDSQQRKLVQQYQRMLIEVADQIAAGKRSVDTSALTEHLEGLGGDNALLISRVELCRRVDGFGVYEPFPGTKFLARRDRKMIVYVELDKFKTVGTDDGRHEVRLAQEISLYNDADGLEVWRMRQETIKDTSRNRRRDFYTVKMIQMPQWLGVGKYRLKVHVTDLNGGTEAESSVEIQFVADEALVSTSSR